MYYHKIHGLLERSVRELQKGFHPILSSLTNFRSDAKHLHKEKFSKEKLTQNIVFSISETVFMPELHILSAAKIKVNIKGSMNLKDTGCQNK